MTLQGIHKRKLHSAGLKSFDRGEACCKLAEQQFSEKETDCIQSRILSLFQITRTFCYDFESP